MEVNPESKTIKSILASGRQFMIPRFQREYSWDKRNYEEFLNDMLGNLVIENGSIKDASYFLGTMLFVGNIMDGTKDKIWVVDGQQRLTTITILFSAMADTFQNINKKTLADKVFTYIMHSDDDGNKIKVLDSSSSYPFFAYYIQDQNKVHEIEPESEEEILIRETYLFFKRSLRVETLKEDLIKFNPGKKSQIMQLDHVYYPIFLRKITDGVMKRCHRNAFTYLYFSVIVFLQVVGTLQNTWR